MLHIAQNHPGLLPEDGDGRARTIMWMFAALNTMEPPIVEREQVSYVEQDKPWYNERLPILDDRIRTRLTELSDRLGDAPWLDGDFSAADLLMVTVLRRVDTPNIWADYPSLAAYIARGQARAAYKRAFAAQLAVFNAASAG